MDLEQDADEPRGIGSAQDALFPSRRFHPQTGRAGGEDAPLSDILISLIIGKPMIGRWRDDGHCRRGCGRRSLWRRLYGGRKTKAQHDRRRRTYQDLPYRDQIGSVGKINLSASAAIMASEPTNALYSRWRR